MSNGAARTGARNRADHARSKIARHLSPCEPIAIIGMRGRFPGANDLEQFWQNLANGVDSVTNLSPDDVRAAGVPDHIMRLPGYVNAAPLLDDVDRFDAEFFGFSARDASLTDPQHRLFLETAWEALEDAGYDPARFPGTIGVFGGCELSTYLYQLYSNIETLGYLDGMQVMVTNDKDHLCTQVSYRLNLRGPSVVVQTTCSTSLVAVSLACESVRSGRSDMALAGGVTVRVPQRGGYFYVPGSILSPDGRCRPFDAEAQGTIVGSGVGVVVLKRLRTALADRDHIRAVILGEGLNNDGNDKVGYTAPSFRGQAEAIKSAFAMAGVSAESISYVEAHGTGTILGDPIEIGALTEVFRTHTDRRGYCGIGSVKSNFGHLSCASGVTGLIKTVLALEKAAIPPTIHYRAPNPAIDLAASPFYVATALEAWTRNGTPRRAGVSSFGVGGTNAHVIVEEAPPRAPAGERRPHQILVLSARTEAALDTATTALAAHLEADPEIDLADVAFTLHTGRREFLQRRCVVVPSDDLAAAVATLREPGRLPATHADGNPPVVFMFPGQGAQYPGMIQGLYESEPVVRRVVDLCTRRLRPHLGVDLRRVLFAGPRRRETAAATLRSTDFAQPALFTVEYALAQLWISWGIRPAAMIGHSVGEYVAATLAEVMSLDDALRLLARRGQLIASLPRGSMLAVMAPAEALAPYYEDGVALAAVNAPGFCVLSGPTPAIERVEAALGAAAIAARRLHTSHAFHSAMMDPILDTFEREVSQVRLSAPRIPYVTSVTGEWADGGPRQPAYWTAQLRSTVRFADGLRRILCSDALAGTSPVLLEVGPGRTLATFAAQTANGDRQPPLALSSAPGAEERRPDTEVMLGTLGRLWSAGVAIDWDAFHGNEERRRVSLPTYPFERQSYWIGTPPTPGPPKEPRDPCGWFYRAVWRDAPLAGAEVALEDRRILVFDEGSGLGAAVGDRLRTAGAQPILVQHGAAFARLREDAIAVDATNDDDFARLAAEVCDSTNRLAGVIDCWSASPPGDTDLEHAAVVSLRSPLRLAHALSDRPTVRPLPVLLVARGSARVHADDVVDPPRAFGIGPAKVVPQEHPGLRIGHVDVDDHPDVAALLVAELAAGATESEVAYRGGERLVHEYEHCAIEASQPPTLLPPKPVVLVTGGLGFMGLILAEGIFHRLGARLVLVGRAALPEPERWAAVSERVSTPTAMRATLARLAALRAERDDVLVVTADLDDADQVMRAIDAAIARFGRVDLVVHGAANVTPAAFASGADTGPSVVAAQLSPKVYGLLHLVRGFRGREPQQWVVHSSISTALGGLGLAAYAGANAVLDAYAVRSGAAWLSIGWDAWENAAEAKMVGMPNPIVPAEGQEAFLRLLGTSVGPCAVVALDDFAARIDAWVRRATVVGGRAAAGDRHQRPNLNTAFVEPRTETERGLAEIWSAQLGVTPVGIHDRFFDLGGHSLLALQVAAEIRDRFEIEMPVLQLFKAPTISELATMVERALTSDGDELGTSTSTNGGAGNAGEAPTLQGPGAAAKASYREFYDDVTHRLEHAGVGEASFFLNYGYLSSGKGDEARVAVPDGVFNPSSVRLVFELIGATELRERRVLDVGCGRGGTAAVLAERFGADVTGVDLAPAAVAFCQRTHRQATVRFEVGDAESLPFDDHTFDVVTNIESSHTYPNVRAFLAEVRRVLMPGGWFLYTDLLPVGRWSEVRALLASLGFTVGADRDITRNVLASCDDVATTRARAFGGPDAMIDNFLAVPGSAVYEQMRSAAWEYRIVRARSR